MKKSFKNILSAAALLMLTATSAFADGEDKGVVANKKVSANEDGTYTLTLEAYATGSSITTVTEESVPLDIVLVLDVSGSMDENFSSYSIYRGRRSLLGEYYYLFNGKYVRVRYTNPNGDYLFIRNGAWRYNSGSGWVELPANAVIYTRKKIDALKNACELFVDNVAKESSNDCTHNIAIVSYASGSSVVKDLTPAHSSIDDLYDAIEGLQADGATRVDLGMTDAKTIIDGIDSDRESNKVVVMFTDGKPTESSSFSATVANSAVTTAKALKDAGVVVYTVGVFDQIDASLHQYMSAVSSDKPNATVYTDGNTSTGDYYMTADSAEDLENIFETISKESTAGSTKSTLTATNSSVRDFVTPEFKIVGTAENIELEVWPSDPTNRTAEPKWLAAQPATGVTATIGAADEDGNTPVIVTGFDYSANWVGPDKTGDTINGWRLEGKKLVIKIKIKLDENANSGGVLQTNTGFSGIYSGEGLEKDFESTGIEFPVPQAVSKSPAVIIIKKATAGAESAIFDVYAAGKLVNTVMVNEATEYKAEILVDWLKDDAPNAINVADLDEYMIPISVVERANWTWNTPATVDAKPLYIVSGSGDTAKATENNVFEFGAGTESAKSDVNHDEESAVINR